jgi:hypothetical protein
MQRVALVLVLLLLGGCTQSLALSLPKGVPVQVISATGATRDFQPSDQAYQQLARWLAQNQGGWSGVYATNPNGGILVRCGNVRLQFVGSAVFALTTNGVFTKSVKESAYAYLAKEPNT